MWLLLSACTPGPHPQPPASATTTTTSTTAPPGPTTTTTTTTTTPTVPTDCAPAPMTPLRDWPVATTEGAGASAWLGPQLVVTGAAVPGAVLDVEWAAADGVSVDWYLGAALTEDCAAIPGDACLWVDGGVVDTSIAAGGTATTQWTVDPLLAVGQAVAIQAVADDGTASPVWFGVYDATAADGDPITGPYGPPARIFPGTYQGLFMRELGVNATLRVDAGERVVARTVFPASAKFDDCPPSLGLYGVESDGEPEYLDWQVYTQTVALEPAVTEWVVFSVWTGFYEPRDSTFDLVLDLTAPLATRTWYADLDGDGWGDPNAPSVAASRPAFSSDVADDCDDGRADVHPEAAESCDDGIDADCDGADACATLATGPGPAATALVAPWDSWPAAQPGGDLTGDGVADFLVNGDVVPGPLSGRIELASAGVARFAGSAVLAVGDLDGDGHDDVAGAPYEGGIHLFAGPFSGEIDATACGEIVDSPLAVGADAFAPQAAGDTDGDGLADLLAVGGFESAGTLVAGLTLYRAPYVGGRTDLDADARIALGSDEPDPGDLAVQSGDLDGDGLADLVMFSEVLAGLWALTAPLTGDLAPGPPDRQVANASSDAALALGDFDGDGAIDIAYSDDLDDPLGLTASVSIVADLGAAPFAIVSSTPGLFTPNPGDRWDEMSRGGDLDGDGAAELILANYRPDMGDALWLSGPLVGTLEGQAVGTSYAGIFDLTAAGDTNGDGFDDLFALGASIGGDPPGTYTTWLLPGGG